MQGLWGSSHVDIFTSILICFLGGVSESVHPRTTTDALHGKRFRELVSDLIALPYLGGQRDWESGTHEIVRARTPRQRPQRPPRLYTRCARMFRAARLIGSGRGAVRVPVRRVRVLSQPCLYRAEPELS